MGSPRSPLAVVSARDPAKLDALASSLKAAGASAIHVLPGDATSSDHVNAVVNKATEAFGKVDAAASCVGSILLKPAHLTTDAEMHQTVATNLFSSFALVRASCAAMMKSGGGSIVLCSSAVARYGAANHEAIAASKAGVVGLALSAAASYAKQNIRVNCVAPGLTRTPLTARITGSEAGLKASEAMHALGRIGEPGDVSRAIEFLLDPENSWITGQVLAVDGGLSTLRPR
eukprot:tig00020909_g15352.t1